MVVALTNTLSVAEKQVVAQQENGLQVDLNISIKLGISADQAKRKLSRFFMDEVSLLIGPEDPLLVLVDTRSVLWRFPLELTLGKRGRLGLVGTVDVDARTGELLITDELLTEIKTNARLLVRGAALPADA